MKEQSGNEAVESSEVCYETLEPWARMKVQEFVQQLLEDEVNALLGRGKHDRRSIRRSGAATAMASRVDSRC